MTQKSKPPLTPRRIFADDLAVEQGGETYYPHAGEFVEFKGRPAVGLYLRFGQLGDSPEAVSLLLEYLTDWDWTDDEGKPYGPPTIEALMRLPAVELGWLLTNAASEPKTEEAHLNGSSPSTAT